MNINRDTTHLPRCLIKTKYPELDEFIRAVLDGIVDFSDVQDPSVIIEDHTDGISLASSDHTMLFVERPFSPDVLVDTVKKLCIHCSERKFSADAENRLAILGDDSVTLTDTEFRLYSAILENGGEFISADELSMAVWGRHDRNLCTVYISYLRRKLNSAFGDGTLITASKKGYRLREPS